jgi:hypothetical protein
VSELPKFVLQRLQASAPGEHPSADLLAAFSEQSLSRPERERLLAHLAACSQCRSFLWLAMPEIEALQPAMVGAPSRRWSWYSAWRWAGIAAGVVVLAGVAILFRGGPGPAGEKLARAPQAPVMDQKRDTQALEAKEAAPAPEARSDAGNLRRKAAPGTRLQAKDMPPKIATEPRQRASANEIAAEGSLVKSEDELSAKVASPAAAAPARAEAVSTMNAAPAAKAAPSATAEADVMIASNIPARAPGKKKLAPPTRWMLSADGALLRSTDAGKNWQTVPFDDNMAFRAVSVVGPNVWVGGQGGALYYSSDDGSQWQRLFPTAGGAALSEDITSLTFRDSQHGSLTTAGGQTWTTDNGGRSWQKQ